MKKIIDYINELYLFYYFDIIDQTTINKLEDSIDDFISLNYKKIERKKYVTFGYDCSNNTITTNICSSLKKELELHYPEKLI